METKSSLKEIFEVFRDFLSIGNSGWNIRTNVIRHGENSIHHLRAKDSAVVYHTLVIESCRYIELLTVSEDVVEFIHIDFGFVIWHNLKIMTTSFHRHQVSQEKGKYKGRAEDHWDVYNEVALF